MSPTVIAGDLLTTYQADPLSISRGMIVIFKAEGIPMGRKPLEAQFIQRIVALPDDVVSIQNGVMHVNGKAIVRGEIHSTAPARLPTVMGTLPDYPLVVPAGKIFLMGDNYSNSLDSRYFGPVDASRVIRRPHYRVFPLDRFGPVE